jgi:hypothetical protein
MKLWEDVALGLGEKELFRLSKGCKTRDRRGVADGRVCY